MPKKTSRRPIERKVAETYSWWGRSFVFIQKTKLKTWQAVFVIAFITGAAVMLVWSVSNNWHPFSQAAAADDYYFTNPTSCVSGWGACWEHNAAHYLKPKPKGALNTYFLHADGRADFSNIKINSAQSVLSLYIIDGSDNSANGFYFKVLVNEEPVYASSLIKAGAAPAAPIETPRIDLSPYAGEVVTISFISESNGDYSWDQAVVVDPVLTYAADAGDNSVFAAPDTCASGWGTCWERNRLYALPISLGAYSDSTYFLHADGRADFNDIAIKQGYKTMLRAQVQEGSGNSTNGFYFKILINGEQKHISPLLTKDGIPDQIYMDVTEYAGQTIDISFVTDSNGDYSWDQAVVLGPTLYELPEEPDVSLTNNSAFGSRTASPGAQDVLLGSFVIGGGNDALRIYNIKLPVNKSVIENLTLDINNGSQIIEGIYIESIADAAGEYFVFAPFQPYNLEAGDTAVLQFTGDISSDVPNGTKLKLSINNPYTSFTMETSAGNRAIFANKESEFPLSSFETAIFEPVISVDPYSNNQPPGRIVVAEQEENVLRFSFQAANDNFTIKELQLKADNSLAVNIDNAFIRYNGKEYSVASRMFDDGMSTFSFKGLDLRVMRDHVQPVEVFIELGRSADINSGSYGRVYLDTIDGFFAQSDATALGTHSIANEGEDVASNVMYVRNGSPLFVATKQANTDFVFSGLPLFRFFVNPAAHNVKDLQIKQIGFNVQANGVEVSELNLYDMYGRKLSKTGAYPDSNGDVKLIIGSISDTDAIVIPARSPSVQEYYVAGDINGWGRGDNLTVKFKEDSGYTANGSMSSIAASNYNVLSDIPTFKDDPWTNGYLVHMEGEWVFSGLPVLPPVFNRIDVPGKVARNERADIYKFKINPASGQKMNLRYFAVDVEWNNQGDRATGLSLENFKLYVNGTDVTDSIGITERIGGGTYLDSYNIKAANEATESIKTIYFLLGQSDLEFDNETTFTINAIPRNFEKGLSNSDMVTIRANKDVSWSYGNAQTDANTDMINSLPLEPQTLEAAF